MRSRTVVLVAVLAALVFAAWTQDTGRALDVRVRELAGEYD